ncbi:hypothetical protein LINPERHAP2_LOCUS37888 [Linum perenne]
MLDNHTVPGQVRPVQLIKLVRFNQVRPIQLIKLVRFNLVKHGTVSLTSSISGVRSPGRIMTLHSSHEWMVEVNIGQNYTVPDGSTGSTMTTSSRSSTITVNLTGFDLRG